MDGIPTQHTRLQYLAHPMIAAHPILQRRPAGPPLHHPCAADPLPRRAGVPGLGGEERAAAPLGPLLGYRQWCVRRSAPSVWVRGCGMYFFYLSWWWCMLWARSGFAFFGDGDGGVAREGVGPAR